MIVDKEGSLRTEPRVSEIHRLIDEGKLTKAPQELPMVWKEPQQGTLCPESHFKEVGVISCEMLQAGQVSQEEN